MRVAMVNPKNRRKSTKAPRKASSGQKSYRAFVKDRMPKLVKQGYKAPEAMKLIGSEWRGKANWGTPKGATKGWRARSARTEKYAKVFGGEYPRHRVSANPGTSRQKAVGKRMKELIRSGTSPKDAMRQASREIRSNPKAPEDFMPKYESKTLPKKGTGISTSGGRNHLSFMSHCLSDMKGSGMTGKKMMAECSKKWDAVRSGEGFSLPPKSRKLKHSWYHPGGTDATGKAHRMGHFKYSGRRARSNPSFGFLPTLGSLKAEFGYIRPKKNQFYPTLAEIKAHPIFAGLGFGVGALSSMWWGGLGRAIGGSNVILSELMGLGGNIIGTELNARLVNSFHFKGANVMAKTVRTGGYFVTIVSALLGLLRIATTLSKGGVAALEWKALPTLKDVKISIPVSKGELVARGKKIMGLGMVGTGNPLSDIVTSGVKQGYTGQEPMGVSGLKDAFMGDDFLSGDGTAPAWADTKAGNPALVQRIKKLASDLGLSDVDLNRMMPSINQDFRCSTRREDCLPGIGDSVVPAAYDGGFMDEFVQ